jgi:hypothetical protein
MERERLQAVRAEAGGRQRARAEERAVDLAAREMKREEPREEPPPKAPTGEPARPPPACPGRPAEDRPTASRAEAALRLVERIEVFLQSGRPRLELSVGGAFQAAVLLERTGPGQVAVTIRGRRGPPPPGDLARVRQHLEARGLKLSALSVLA